MVDVKLLINNDDEISYQYFVEGDTEKVGIISYDKIEKKYYLIKEARGDNHGSYSGHAFILLRKFVENNSFPEKDMAMWY